MQITKIRIDLKPGTVVHRRTGAVEILKEYDGFHRWYECKDCNTGEMLYLTPIDLIGGEV